MMNSYNIIPSSLPPPPLISSPPPPLPPPGTVEVFGSWTKVAPRLDAETLAADLERQLAEAIGEHEQNAVTIVAGGKKAARSGFYPPGESH